MNKNETEELDDVYQLLNKITSLDGTNNLYEHLQKLFEAKENINDDRKFSDLFEDISIRIKATGKYFNEDKVRESLLNYLNGFNTNVKGKKLLLEPPVRRAVDQDPEPITQVNYVPDYHALFQNFEWAGITLGEKESLLLRNSLRNLASNIPNGNVVFWGKIYGKNKDYYIAEATGVDPSPGIINLITLRNSIRSKSRKKG